MGRCRRPTAFVRGENTVEHTNVPKQTYNFVKRMYLAHNRYYNLINACFLFAIDWHIDFAVGCGTVRICRYIFFLAGRGVWMTDFGRGISLKLGGTLTDDTMEI